MQENVICIYFDVFFWGDLVQFLDLFVFQAIVYFFFYGQQVVCNFYFVLLQDSFVFNIEFLYIFNIYSIEYVVVNFFYYWIFVNGEQVIFDCVDIFCFDVVGKIIEFKIIYDVL